MSIFTKNMSKKSIFMGALVATSLVVVLLELTDTTYLFHKPAPFNTVPNIETGSSKLPADLPKNEVPSSTSNANNGTQNTNSSFSLASPSGSFVSNHKPNLSGSPAPNQEESVCVTTPGAQCEIIFTKDGVTKTLPTKTVGANGSASWEWTLQEIGLTEGNWQVSAKATSGSQVKTTIDSLLLEVRP